MPEPRLTLLGVGHHLPSDRVPSAALEPLHGYPPGWAAQHIGIRERRTAPDEVLSWHLGVAACRPALERAGVTAADVDLLLVHGSCPELFYPDAAWFIARDLGVPDTATVLGFRAACAGFVAGLRIAEQFLRAGGATTALVVSPERMFRPSQGYDRAALLFGDGAAAAVVRLGMERGVRYLALGQRSADAHRCLLATTALAPASRGAVHPDLAAHWGPGARPEPEDGNVGYWDGGHIFQSAVTCMGDASLGALAHLGLGLDDVDHFLFHQANAKILKSLVRNYELPEDRVRSNIGTVGNISSATVPVLLSQGLETGAIVPGQRVLMAAFGAGYTWGVCLLEV